MIETIIWSLQLLLELWFCDDPEEVSKSTQITNIYAGGNYEL